MEGFAARDCASADNEVFLRVAFGPVNPARPEEGHADGDGAQTREEHHKGKHEERRVGKLPGLPRRFQPAVSEGGDAFEEEPRRGQRRGLSWGVTKAEREIYREKLKSLNLGLEDRMTVKVGLLSGGQRQALTLLMAALQKPKLLLLDEHTAALDPSTAAKVLEISDKIVQENQLTAMMITHNMSDAIRHGNRLIMMNEGSIILDISGEEKKKLTKQMLMEKFAQIAGAQVDSDQVLLSK